MKKFFTIGEIAQLLNVSAPTLRFWETKGLLSVSKSANLYRQYTFQDLVHIADVIFYRNLGIPIKKMKYFEEFNLEQYNQALDEEKSALLEQIQLYNTMYNGILTKKRHIHDVSTLKNVDFIYGEIPFENVVRFDYS
ncbi:MAG: MerR family transcriptional regulator, partial [Oscillospiraceae bacterium]